MKKHHKVHRIPFFRAIHDLISSAIVKVIFSFAGEKDKHIFVFGCEGKLKKKGAIDFT